MQIGWTVSALAIVGLAVGVGVQARLGAGPWGPLPGAALRGDAAPAGFEPNWSELGAGETVEVQVGSADGRQRSVLACLIVHEGNPYLSVTLLPLKRWHRIALRTGSVTVRGEGLLFERAVRVVDDPELHAALKQRAWQKYRSYEFGDGWAGRNLAFLRLDPIASSLPTPGPRVRTSS